MPPILVRRMHCNDSVTPRYARLGGWLLLAGAIGTVVACSTPTVDGTDIDSASQGASSGKRTKRTTSTKKTTDDEGSGAAPTSTATGSASNNTPMTNTTAVPSTTSTTPTTPTGTTTSPAPSTTATTPVVQQPACGSNDPAACLNCCLNANPGATQFEDNYEACMSTCPQGDDLCLDDCQRQHVSQCAANATCSKNHACMEANNCLNTNYCNPI